MRFLLGAVLVCGLLVGSGGAAQALLVDDFSVGTFNLTGGSVGTTGTQACGSFCLGTSREVFIQSGSAVLDATAQLFPGEAVNVMPDGGGTLSFSYAPLGADVVDLTVGGNALQSEISFTAFEPGATVRVTVDDDNGLSETVSIVPSFNPAPTPSLPGVAVVLHSSFVSGVDLTIITAYTVTIDAPAAGDYHTSLIEIPELGPSKTNVLSLPGSTVTTGGLGAYPSDPPLDIRVSCPPQPVTPCYEIELTLVDVTDGGGQQVAANVVGSMEPDDSRTVFLATSLPSPGLTSTLQYRLDYLPSPGETPPIDLVPVLWWNPGDNHFEVMVDVQTNGDVQTFTLFGEVGLPSPGIITNVSVAKGNSTLVTVEITGASASSPALQLACNGGEHVASTAVPVLGPWPLAFLLLALLTGGVVSVGRVRQPVSGSVC